MKNLYREHFFRFRLSHLLLLVIWTALVFSLHEHPRFAAGAGALMITVYLHILSLGRTSPLAAFAFIISTAVIGLVAGLPYLVAELKEKEWVSRITQSEINDFFVAIPCYAMVVAGVVAVIVAIDNRDEWFNHLR